MWKVDPSAASPAVFTTVIEGATSSNMTFAESEPFASEPPISSSAATTDTVSVAESPAFPLTDLLKVQVIVAPGANTSVPTAKTLSSARLQTSPAGCEPIVTGATASLKELIVT